MIAPLILIAFLYLPTIIYVTKISINFYGWKNWMTSILNDPVYFIFPILTSMSFYGKPKSPQNDDKGRNEDVINMNAETFESVEETGNEPARQMNFSVRQSNILYILFIFGFILCIGADVLHQYTRKNKETNYLSSTSLTFYFRGSSLSLFTSMILITFCVNFVLWSDFILVASQPLASESHGNFGGVVQELVNYTTDSLYCIILFPIFCLQKIISNR